jgi:hypothetical protein
MAVVPIINLLPLPKVIKSAVIVTNNYVSQTHTPAGAWTRDNLAKEGTVMGNLVHTGLGSSSLVAHVLPYPPPSTQTALY